MASPEKRVIVRREASVEVFSASQVALINKVIRTLWDNSAREELPVPPLHRLADGRSSGAHPLRDGLPRDPERFTPSEEELDHGEQLAREIGAA